ncbi:MAG: hypothetical protein IJO74_05100 [Clostridia bacterium]|nr:hypothetical protein [Clostridia bacterium]
MKKLTTQEILSTYKLISEYHKKYLKKYGVILPNLHKGDSYTKDALVLIYLAQGYPDTKIISKTELTEFIKIYYPNTNDVQQARHLGAQKGWYILSGTRNDNTSINIPSGSYKLKSLTECYSGFTAERREELFSGDYWENLKKAYGYRCACCGSEEGRKHRYWNNITVVLQKGHKDPTKPLEEGNIIPQCESCNRPDRNYWVYDDKGRVISISNEKVIDGCSRKVQKAIYSRLYKKFNGMNPEEI